MEPAGPHQPQNAGIWMLDPMNFDIVGSGFSMEDKALLRNISRNQNSNGDRKKSDLGNW